MTGFEETLLGAAAGGLMALVGQRVSDTGRRRDNRTAQVDRAKEALDEHLHRIDQALSYHGGLLEMLCRRFNVRPRLIDDSEREEIHGS